MKKIALIAALGLMGMGSAMAQTATGNFNVVLNLASKCEVNSTNTGAAVISDLTMSYTSFQTTAATGSTNFNVRCTNLLPYSITLNNTTTVTDDVVNLGYTLNLSSASVYSAGTNGSLPGLTANGSNQTYYVHGTVASGQAGTCATANCTNALALNRGRTVTVSY